MTKFEEEVLKRIEEIGRKLDAALKAKPASGTAAAMQPASDADLDGKYGDPVVKFRPKKWDGADYTGCCYSATEPAFLEVLAEALAWSADHPRPGKEQYSNYDRKDAARAVGWAQRLRRQGVGAQPPEPPPDSYGYGRGHSYGGHRPTNGNGRGAGPRAPAGPADAGGPPPADDDGGYGGGADDDIPFVSSRGTR